jgi:hypothetical protein
MATPKIDFVPDSPPDKIDFVPDAVQPKAAPQTLLGSLANSAPVQDVLNAGGGVSDFMTHSLANVLNIPHNFISNKIPAVSIPNAPFTQPNSWLYQAGNIAPAVGLPLGEANVASRVLQNAPKLTERALSTFTPAVQKLGANVANNVVKGGKALDTIGQGALLGYLGGDPNNPYSNAATGAVVGGITHGVANAIPGVTNLGKAVINSQLKNYAEKAKNKVGFLRTPEEAQRINQQVGNVPVNFGEIVDNPELTRALYSAGKMLPFSGVKDNPPILVRSAYDAANNLFNGLNPKEMTLPINGEMKNISITPANSNSVLNQVLQKNHGAQEKISQDLYQKALDFASQNKVKIPLNNYVDALTKLKNQKTSVPINSTLRATIKNALERFSSPLDNIPQTESKIILSPGSTYQGTPNVKSSNLYKQIPFATAHFEKSDLNDLARNFKSNNDTKNYARATKLTQALEKDIEENGYNQNPELKKLYQTAQNNFEKNVTPYRKEPISSFIRDDKDATTLHKYLMNDKNATVLSHMSPQEKSLAVYNYLVPRANLDISPAMTAGAFRQIPEAVKPNLLTPQQIEDFNRVNALHEVTKEAAKRYEPPATGMRTALHLENLEKFAAPTMLAKGLGMVKGGMAAAPLLAMGRKGMKLAYSPELRQMYAQGKQFPYEKQIAPMKSWLARLPAALAINYLNQSDQQ